jgi:hypothetical protein
VWKDVEVLFYGEKALVVKHDIVVALFKMGATTRRSRCRRRRSGAASCRCTANGSPQGDHPPIHHQLVYGLDEELAARGWSVDEERKRRMASRLAPTAMARTSRRLRYQPARGSACERRVR